MGVGKMIKQVLQLRKMSQTELAARLSIPLSTLNGYILGKYEPDLDKLKEIADILDVSVNYLLEIESAGFLSEDELSLVKRYRKLDERKMFMALEYFRFLEV